MTAKVRYELTQLWPSEIADQLYCEYKVHLRRTHPEVQLASLALDWGEANHAALAAQAVPITQAEIDKSIREGKKLALCEWTLEGVFRDVSLRGRPDFFAFEGKNALLVLDFKFSGGDRPYRSQEMQAALYALLADSMGFATADLCFGIVLFPRHGGHGRLEDALAAKEQRLRTLQADGTLAALYESADKARKAMVAGRSRRWTVEGKGWTLFLYRYDRITAEKDLNWALDFWVGQREPQPEKRYPRKCAACPFNAAGLCEYALTPADGRFQVQRSPEGKVLVLQR
jgi:hypothetical protein